MPLRIPFKWSTIFSTEIAWPLVWLCWLTCAGCCACGVDSAGTGAGELFAAGGVWGAASCAASSNSFWRLDILIGSVVHSNY